jgi:hypothetical protein
VLVPLSAFFLAAVPTGAAGLESIRITPEWPIYSRGDGASERIQERKKGKQRTDTGFQTNYGKKLSL